MKLLLRRLAPIVEPEEVRKLLVAMTAHPVEQP
jgi:hypothetical protein